MPPARRRNPARKRKADTAPTVPTRLLTGAEDGLEVRHFGAKGRGVVATRPFHKGEFILEYKGDLVTRSEANERIKLYSLHDNSYILEFKYKEKWMCIDATAETPHLGRLVNHARGDENLKLQLFAVDGQPRVGLVAKQDIQVGEELTYDYAEWRRDVLRDMPWLKAKGAQPSAAALPSWIPRVEDLPPPPPGYPPVIHYMRYVVRAYTSHFGIGSGTSEGSG
ncbi:histone-lysine N-methyltransferase PR-Set7-like [Thrips palmi]|uniref:Histone-lysine N-methyltransferase PR-Set7-like n=1 Tax=Thrips palmi TaxID=161013 RepID=A0A6P9A351_THRPL|nr:histone-lysine N-methyltransferase PR-Set7-like [Thrips palmi]XP_034252283.1 histone-lysine N-methyltransferase PR-Set7-like [Thrips palmi]XP_034252284.1 histone-lysine N-methyltransferase PR-Set7-like [Thrips palmi]XP_034252285.1 histone-lysine N-methyltransferase PR-Set7-like [Thrips palmi]XP_034252286.1 histone-lysine N-methyltransferase PR-Set7-like [Thrips palmi]XP_034252287.1 histone-lysine N-methyltransferase PR-Set7-like [Thrips palmi]XP_034252288.1 histone-lysine N-methyltransfera